MHSSSKMSSSGAFDIKNQFLDVLYLKREMKVYCQKNGRSGYDLNRNRRSTNLRFT
jgi:hypothetical protein